MITLMVFLNILVCIMCWRYADNFEPGSIAWILFMVFSAWNAVEALAVIIH